MYFILYLIILNFLSILFSKVEFKKYFNKKTFQNIYFPGDLKKILIKMGISKIGIQTRIFQILKIRLFF